MTDPAVQSAAGSLSRDRQIEQACTQFELAWKTGARPKLADHLDRFAHSERSAALPELLALDVYYRQRLGESPCAEDYLAELQVFATVVRSFFSFPDTPNCLNAETLGPNRPWPNVPGYVIQRELGQGGMGIVYLARQLQPRRQVAIKMLRDGPDALPEAQARFRREWDAVARLQHPNIVPVFAVGEADGRLFMAVEHVAGGSLNRALAGRPMQPLPAAELVLTLAQAMAHAHDLGIIHRDLKPANVLIADRGPPSADSSSTQAATQSNEHPGPTPNWSPASHVVKIADFGLAKFMHGDDDNAEAPRPTKPFDPFGQGFERTHTGEALGTPSYMAPEQIDDAKDIGPPTDVYALGAILYECLTGRPPFRAPTVAETLEHVAHAAPIPPRQCQPSVPLDLQTICLKCLEKPPAQRYATAHGLADDLLTGFKFLYQGL